MRERGDDRNQPLNEAKLQELLGTAIVGFGATFHAPLVVLGDRVEENLHPIGRAYDPGSTLLCTPGSLAQEVGLALGAQAGERRVREVVMAGGFTRFRRATETTFRLVFEARR